MAVSEQKLLGKKLLFLTAHPDDEAFLAAGLIYKNHKYGGESCVVCATAGEKGKSHLSKPVSSRELKKIRKTELMHLSECCCVSRLVILSFPDTRLQEHKSELKKYFVSMLKEFDPDYILSFGSDGVSGHADHIACYEVASKVAKKKSLPLICFCRPPLLQRKHRDWSLKRRKFGKYKEVRLLKPNLRIKIDQKMKLKCFKCHKSQAPLQAMPADALKQVLNFEYFLSR